MSKQTINNGDTGLESRTKINENFTEVYQDLFDTSREYKVGESVIINNSGLKEYLCNANTSAGESPITTPSKWDLIGGGGGGNVIESLNNTFSSALDFTIDSASNIYYDVGIQAGALAFTLGVAAIKQGVYVYALILADTSAITFPDGWKEIKNEYASDNAYYGLMVYYDGTFYQYQLYTIGFVPNWDNSQNATISGNDVTATSALCQAEDTKNVLSGEGYIQQSVQPSAEVKVIGFDEALGLLAYTDFDFGIYYNGSEIRCRVGAVQTGYVRAIPVNSLLRIERVESSPSVFDIEFKFFNGTIWETLQTENGVTSNDLRPKYASISSSSVLSKCILVNL